LNGKVVRCNSIFYVLGLAALRYLRLSEVVFGQDGNFSYDAMIQRYNADLANGLGKLESRVLTMIEKYFDGKIPNSLSGVRLLEGEGNPDRGIKETAQFVASEDVRLAGARGYLVKFDF